MSIKIYNGYEIKKMNLLELLTFCKKFQSQVTKVRDKLTLDLITHSSVEELDSRAVGTSKPHEIKSNIGVLSQICSELNKRVYEIERTQHRDPMVDFGCNATFIPLKNKTLVLFNSEQTAFIEIWLRCEEIKDHHYQTSVDKPKYVSTSEWKQRAKDWELALPGLGIPSQAGFSFDFTDSKIPMAYVPDIIRNQPTFNLWRCFNQLL